MITQFGFEHERLIDIIGRMEQKCKDAFGSNIDLSPEGPLGQLLNVFAYEVSRLKDNQLDIYHAFDIGSSEAINLDNLIAINNIKRYNGETDEELRRRQEISVVSDGKNFADAIVSHIKTIQNVNSVVIVTNNTDQDEDIPSRSFMPVVDGGDEKNIIDVIWKNTPCGVNSFGTIKEDVIDSSGFSHIVSFSRPTVVDIFIKVITQNNILEENKLKEIIITGCQEIFKIGVKINKNRIFRFTSNFEIDDIFVGTDEDNINLSSIDMPLKIGRFAKERVLIEDV